MLIFDTLDLNNAEQLRQVVTVPTIYVKDLNIKIGNYRGHLKITDLTNAMQHGKQCNTVVFDFWHSADFSDVCGLRGFSNFLDDFPLADVITNWRNGFQYRQNDFCFYGGVDIRYGAADAKKIFTPFVQPKKQKLVAGKNGRIAVTTFVKAVLAGQIDKVICDGKYTDDFYHDHITNYSKGKVYDAIEFAESIFSQGGWSVFPEHSKPDTLNISFLANDFYRAIIK